MVVYTPLKRRSSFATVIGAIPGALPPVIGWAAASGSLSQGAWVLFGIVFLWQLPHFLAIAWIYREDYARAGFPMLPVIEPDGRSTGRQAVGLRAALLPLSLAPTLMGMTGTGVFRRRARPARLLFLVLTLKFARTRARPRRAPALLRIDHLPAAAVDPDDRGQVGDLVGRRDGLRSSRPQRHAERDRGVLLRRLDTVNQRGRMARHRAVMIAAFVTSVLFLISYVIYHAQVGSRPFPGRVRSASSISPSCSRTSSWPRRSCRSPW